MHHMSIVARRRAMIALSLIVLIVMVSIVTSAASQSIIGGSRIQPAASVGPVHLPVVLRNVALSTSWTQLGGNPQRTSYVASEVPTPWRKRWIWNGANSSGAIVSDKVRLPRNSQPVVGGGRVYVAAGSRGVYAINNANGSVVWNRNPGGNINATPAYDTATGALFVVSSNGTLYKLDAATGATLGQFASGSTSDLPLAPAVIADRVFFSMGNRVYAINNATMAQIWAYDAGSAVHTPPAYSASRNRVVVVSSDLYVHAINNTNGARAWRVKPTPLSPGNPADAAPNAEARNGWPVIAEEHGLVLIRYRLNWQTLWTWNPWPSTNAAMRSNLASRPDQQSLHVLRLADGATAFIANVGHGGFGDGGYMPMGPQPVIKRFSNGQEVAYVVMRGSPCANTPCDGRYDSFLGEMVLDNTTVSGYQAGYVRYIQNTFFPTDEQVNLSMAGDQLFGGHWEAGIAHRIVDRSAARGSSSSNRITTSNLPHVVTSQDQDVCSSGYSSSHYCSRGLVNTRTWPSGFYIYWRQGAVYDRYWSEYASWVISDGVAYFVSTDGAIIALERGNPTAGTEEALADGSFSAAAYGAPALDAPAAPERVAEVIPYEQAAEYAGKIATVEGDIRYVFNNGLAVYLGFTNPHQGAFKVRILKRDWGNFTMPAEQIYGLDQRIRVTGLIGWYQGDPVIYVTDPSQIEVLKR